MKKLKVKLGLLSLLAILAVSAFLTSCEQESTTSILEDEITLTEQPQVSENTSGDLLLMPYGFDELSEETQVQYFKNITEENLEKLTENHRIGAYLRSIDQLENVTNELMSEGLLFADVDISQVLTTEELNQLVDYEYGNIESRGVCGSWSFRYEINEYPHGCLTGYPEYRCCSYSVFRKRCVGWGIYYKYRYVNQCL